MLNYKEPGLKRMQEWLLLSPIAAHHGKNCNSYVEARRVIYLPSYSWVLAHRLQDLLAELRRLEAEKTVVLLDYETNCNVEDVTQPLSHAGLIKLYLEGSWPMI